jgi:hypothetical protein
MDKFVWMDKLLGEGDIRRPFPTFSVAQRLEERGQLPKFGKRAQPPSSLAKVSPLFLPGVATVWPRTTPSTRPIAILREQVAQISTHPRFLQISTQPTT